MNFNVTIEGGCLKYDKLPIRVRMQNEFLEPFLNVSGQVISNHFTHYHFIQGGQTIELYALNSDGTEKHLDLDALDQQNITFSLDFNNNSSIQSKPIAVKVQLGDDPFTEIDAYDYRIDPFFERTVLPGQTIFDALGPTTGNQYYRYQINGDIVVPYVTTDFIFPNFTPPPYLELPLPNSSTGITSYTFNPALNPQFTRPLALMMASGSSMVIDSDVKFTVINGSFQGCDEMWKGVNLENGASVVLENTLIADAQFGLKYNGSSHSFITNSEFRNNNFSIYSVTSQGGLSPNIVLTGNKFHSTADGLKPAYSGQFPNPGNTGYAGMYIENHSLLNVGNTSGSTNRFNDLQNGIVAKKSNIQVRNSIFSHMEQTTVPFGYPLASSGNGIFVDQGSLHQYGLGDDVSTSPVSFSNCTNGIRARSASIYIYDNRMQDVLYGVRFISSVPRPYRIENNNIRASEAGIAMHQLSQMPGGASIADNTITINGNPAGVGIKLGGIFFTTQKGGVVKNNAIYVRNAAKGIELNRTNELTVSNNTVYLQGGSNYVGIQANGGYKNAILCNNVVGSLQAQSTSAGPEATDFINIRAYQSMSSPENEWGCNLMTGSGIGMEFSGASELSDIRGNYFSELNFGLQIGLAPANGDAFTGPQVHRGNVWNDGTLFNAGANYLGSPFAVDFSKFTVDDSYNSQGINSIYFPNSIAGPLGWFEIQSDNNSTFQCSGQQLGYPLNCAPLSFIVPTREQLETTISKGEVLGTHFEDALNWTAQKHLYRRLNSEGNPYIGNPFIADFLSSGTNQTLQDFGDIESDLQILYSLSSSDSNTIQTRESHLGQLFTNLAEAEIQLADTTLNESDLDSLHQAIRGFIQSAEGTSESILDLVGTIDSLVHVGSTIVQISNGTLPDTMLYQSNEKVVNAIFISTIAQKQPISSSNISTLENIAGQCPLEGGDGVIAARNLLETIDTSARFYNDAILCQSFTRPTSFSKTLNNNEVSFVVRPNPANDRLILEYSLMQESTYQFSMVDLQGKLLFEQSIPGGTHTIPISLPLIPNGLYLYRISNLEGIIHSGKFLVQQ